MNFFQRVWCWLTPEPDFEALRFRANQQSVTVSVFDHRARGRGFSVLVHSDGIDMEATTEGRGPTRGRALRQALKRHNRLLDPQDRVSLL